MSVKENLKVKNIIMSSVGQYEDNIVSLETRVKKAKPRISPESRENRQAYRSQRRFLLSVPCFATLFFL